MQNQALERKRIIETSKSIDAFHRLSLSKLDLLSDDELDNQFARTTDLELVAWLTRAEIFRIKLERNKEAGSPKSRKQIAEELAALKNLHFKTLITDSRIAELFNKYKVDLPKNIYQMVLPLAPARQSEALALAEFHRQNGSYTEKSFKQKIAGMKIVAAKKLSDGKKHRLTIEITDRELADLNKIQRGAKGVPGWANRNDAVGYAIRFTWHDIAYKQSKAGYSNKKQREINEAKNYE